MSSQSSIVIIDFTAFSSSHLHSSTNTFRLQMNLRSGNQLHLVELKSKQANGSFTRNMRSKVGVPHIESIPENKLPTELKVLGFFLWRRKSRQKKSVKAIALQVIKKVLNIWNAAYIPAISLQHAWRKFQQRKGGILKR